MNIALPFHIVLIP